MPRTIVFALYCMGLTLMIKTISCEPLPTVTLSEWKINAFKNVARHIRETINYEIDPCIDYYGYVCDKFNKSEAIFKRTINLEYFLAHENMLSKNADKNKIEAEIKMENFLDSCNTKNTVDYHKLLKTLRYPQSVGGWPVFNDGWSENEFDLVSTVGELKRFGLQTLFGLSFERRTEGNFFKISPKTHNICANRDELERIFTWLNIPAASQQELINDCAYFEQEYLQAASSAQNDEAFNTTLGGLRKAIPEFDWNKYFGTVTGRSINDDFPIRVESFESFKKAIKRSLNIDRISVANYFFCDFIDKVYTHVVRETSCYSETFLNFHPIVYRHIRDHYFNKDTKDYILSVVKSLLDGLFSSLNIFEGETSESALQQIEKILDDDFIPKLNDDAVNKVYQNLEINRDNYIGNIVNLYHYHLEKFCKEFFKEDKKTLIRYLFNPQIFMQSAYHSYNKPSPVAFTLFGMPFLSDSVMYYRNLHGYSDSVRECFKRQLKISKELDTSDLHGIEGTDIYVKSYNNWAKKNEKIIQKENEIFKEFDFTSRKIFFVLAMENACGYGDKEAPYKIILSTLGNLNDFSEEYNCPKGSPMNPEEKCSYK